MARGAVSRSLACCSHGKRGRGGGGRRTSKPAAGGGCPLWLMGWCFPVSCCVAGIGWDASCLLGGGGGERTGLPRFRYRCDAMPAGLDDGRCPPAQSSNRLVFRQQQFCLEVFRVEYCSVSIVPGRNRAALERRAVEKNPVFFWGG